MVTIRQNIFCQKIFCQTFEESISVKISPRQTLRYTVVGEEKFLTNWSNLTF